MKIAPGVHGRFVVDATIRRVAASSSPDGKARNVGNKMYLVRLRFWRARGLLSTSGGRELATVVGEWLRKAICPSWLRELGDEQGAIGRGEEPGMLAERKGPILRPGRATCVLQRSSSEIRNRVRKDGRRRWPGML